LREVPAHQDDVVPVIAAIIEIASLAA